MMPVFGSPQLHTKIRQNRLSGNNEFSASRKRRSDVVVSGKVLRKPLSKISSGASSHQAQSRFEKKKILVKTLKLKSSTSTISKDLSYSKLQHLDLKGKADSKYNRQLSKTRTMQTDANNYNQERHMDMDDKQQEQESALHQTLKST